MENNKKINEMSDSSILSLSEAKKLAEENQNLGKSVVFTNGCFDILHAGHVQYLQKARDLGDMLIVAINSDASVKKIKGDQRPINSEEDRAYILKGLRSVDAVIVFNEDTPYEVIKELVPDVLVKGGDWAIEKIVGKDIVEENGGEVKTISFLEGRSTTNVIEKVLKAYR